MDEKTQQKAVELVKKGVEKAIKRIKEFDKEKLELKYIEVREDEITLRFKGKFL